jgi:isochorismate synthase EntC
MIDLQIARAGCAAAHAQAVLAGLDHREGLYFGVDAGIAGLHPLQATLIEQAAIRLRLWDDGLEAQALSPFGQAVLDHGALSAWRVRTARGTGHGALDLARQFLACLARSADVMLLGALPFAAHRFAHGPGDGSALGVLYFPERLLRRDGDGDGNWRCVTLSLDGVASVAGPEPVYAPVAPASAEPGDDHAPGGYAEMVRHALRVLQQRPLVSLTLSQSYRRRVALAPSHAFARLRQANPAPATFFLNDGSGLRLFGASPDLQLVVRNREIQALPVCGTVARRPGAQGEAQSLRELFNEEVDAAALAVCSDALRNDLAPLCEPGSLRLLDRRRPMSLATVVHAVDRVAGRLREGADAWDAIAATAAPVMLTGMPRGLALQAIAELEPSPRGWYGGMVVQVASDGDALVGTILRAAAVRGDIAEVRTGGDLLAGSSPEREEAESRLKTRSLWRAFDLDDAGRPAVAHSPSLKSRTPRTVRLVAVADPFAAALADLLQGLDMRLSDSAEVSVLAGDTLPESHFPARVVAIGDAAYRVLAMAGATIAPCAAEQGRALECVLTCEAPLQAAGVFSAGRYARFRLPAQDLHGWSVWARDTQGSPVLLLREGIACVLYRPDSLLGDATAIALFDAAVTAVACR